MTIESNSWKVSEFHVIHYEKFGNNIIITPPKVQAI